VFHPLHPDRVERGRPPGVAAKRSLKGKPTPDGHGPQATPFPQNNGKRYPGISKVKRDSGGAIIIDEDTE